MLLLILLLFLCVYYVWLNIEIYKLSWKLQGPFSLPIIGNLLEIPNIRKVSKYFDDHSKRYQNPFRLWIGPHMIVYIADAENAEIVLKSKHCINKPRLVRKLLMDITNVDGLITLDGDNWRSHRRIIAPNLNYTTMKPFIPKINDIISDIISQFPSNNEHFDILRNLTTCTLIIFSKTVTGTLHDKALFSVDKYHNVFEITHARFFQPLFYINAFWKLSSHYNEIHDLATNAYKMLSDILRLRQENESRNFTILDKLIDATSKTSFTNEDLKTELLILTLAATDTSALVASTVLVLLAMHSDIQERVFEEVALIMPDKSSHISSDNIEKLSFLSKCINEAMRLFPPTSVMTRETSESIQLKSGITIPSGVPLIIGVRQIHRNVKYWGSNANIFDPSRFDEDQVKGLPAACFIPFSYGPRNCPGIVYGNIAVKCIVAHIVRRYRVKTTYKNLDEIDIIQSATFRFVNGHMVQLEERN